LDGVAALKKVLRAVLSAIDPQWNKRSNVALFGLLLFVFAGGVLYVGSLFVTDQRVRDRVFAGAVLASATRTPTPTPTPTPTATPTPTPTREPPELILARSQEPGAGNALVTDFRLGLERVERNCELTQTETAILVMNARLVLDREGVRNFTMLEVLNGWGYSLDQPRPSRLSRDQCAGVLDVFLTLIRNRFGR